MGYCVTLIGRRLPNSLNLKRSYKTYRMKLFFNKGFLFYAEYNIRLFFKLLFTKAHIQLSNDLDTLLPNFIVSKILNRKLVYDSHELFTEIPELNNRPFVKKVWIFIEKNIFPKLKNVYTVNQEIANVYKKKYNVNVNVIRNIAPKYTINLKGEAFAKKVKGNKTMLILQGTGINIDRGAEEAVRMMQYIDNTILYIIGGGDVFNDLKILVKELDLKEKVTILDKIPYKELMKYTNVADFGLSLDKPTNMNYELALPNKVFDYIQAQTPLIASNRKVIANLVKNENLGLILERLEPEEMAKKIKETISDKDKINTYKKNLIEAANKYCWENESVKLKEIFKNLN